MAVRQGIEKVIYGKDNITVRFRWGLSPTEKRRRDRLLPPIPGRSAPPAVRPPEKEKRPAPVLGTDPLFQFATDKMWSKISRPQTIDLNVPNISHGYWENFELTGEYNLRPTL
ncbi:MAG: hypothetical protein IPK56_03745 [Elusimicrobia bacterium]|nr:hypothetical protein [Elusimicrobiota bacterium]